MYSNNHLSITMREIAIIIASIPVTPKTTPTIGTAIVGLDMDPFSTVIKIMILLHWFHLSC